MKHSRRAIGSALVLLIATSAAHADTPPPETAAPPPDSSEATATAAAVKAALDEDRRLRFEHDRAESQYQHEMITFGEQTIVSGTSHGGVTTSNVLIPYRGGHPLSADEFYTTVDRPDLAATYHRRTAVGVGGVILGSTVMVGGALLLLKATPQSSKCTPTDLSGFDACLMAEEARNSAQESKWLGISLGVAGGGLVISLVGLYYLHTRNPSMEQLNALADGYNAKLRHRYLESSLRPRIQQVAWAPYATGDGGGFALSGRF